MMPPREQRGLRWMIVCLALAGAWVSGTLLAAHDGGWSTGAADTHYPTRFCKTQTVPSSDCPDVIAGRWGSFDVYTGSRRVVVPTSFVGLAYFVAVGIWFLMVWPIDASARWLWRGMLLAVTFGLAGSVFFMGLMGLALDEWCPLCVIAHGLNAALFIGVVLLWRAGRRSCAGDSAANATVIPEISAWRHRLVVVAGVSISGAVGGLWLYYEAAVATRQQWRKLHATRQVIQSLQSDPDFVLREYYAQPVVEIPSRDSAEALRFEVEDSAADRPRLVIFTDYNCPACACFEAGRRTLIDAPFAGSLTVDFRHYSEGLSAIAGESEVNGAGSTGAAVLAAHAAEAARLQGDTEALARMRMLLFKHRRDRPAPDFAALARAVGLDVRRFLADLHSDEVCARVEADIALARKLGLTSTPTVFLNGRRVPDLCLNSRTFWSAVSRNVSRGDEVATVQTSSRSQ